MHAGKVLSHPSQLPQFDLILSQFRNIDLIRVHTSPWVIITGYLCCSVSSTCELKPIFLCDPVLVSLFGGGALRRYARNGVL